MRENDVFDSVGVKASPLQLPEGGKVFVEGKAPGVHELLAKTLSRLLHFDHAQASIDQDQAGFVLEKKAVTRADGVRVSGQRPQRATIQMMNLRHGQNSS